MSINLDYSFDSIANSSFNCVIYEYSIGYKGKLVKLETVIIFYYYDFYYNIFIF